MIKFTIVTVTYNAAGVFMRTAASVARQTYPDVEHLIIDGASTDGTVELAEEYKRTSEASCKGHYIHIVSERDKGLYHAMDKGRRLATGDYICFLNAGDFFPDESTLAVVAANARLNELDETGGQLPAVVYGDTDWVDNDGKYIGKRHLSAPEQLTWRSFRHGMLVCHQAFYARTDIAQMVPYDLSYRHSSDVDWCIRVMKEAEGAGLELVNVHTVVADYQREGQSTKYHRMSLLERFDVMRRHYGLLPTMAMHLWFVVRALRRHFFRVSEKR